MDYSLSQAYFISLQYNPPPLQGTRNILLTKSLYIVLVSALVTESLLTTYYFYQCCMSITNPRQRNKFETYLLWQVLLPLILISTLRKPNFTFTKTSNRCTSLTTIEKVHSMQNIVLIYNPYFYLIRPQVQTYE